MKRCPQLIWIVTVVSIVACLSVMLMPEDVLARAGGGGGFSGGGSSGGGGFGGGGSSNGGGGQIIALIIWLCVKHPLIGIPLVIVAVIGFIFFSATSSRRGMQFHRGTVIRRAAGINVEADREQGLALIQDQDPSFSEQAFNDRIHNAFLKIQEAWSKQQLGPIRPFVSDGIYERFTLQIAEQADFGYRNVMENVVTNRISVAKVECGQTFDTVTCRIDASATDYRISLATEKEIPGSRREERFVEYWSCLRRHDAATQSGPGLIEGACPNCGSPIELSQSARCGACDSLLRSGEHDWVLCEITQESEWTPARSGKIAGEEAYRSDHDSGFNTQHIEDRASVIFWRQAMADRLGDIAPIAKVASPMYCEKYEQQLGEKQSGRKYLGDLAVGAVDTLGLLPGEPFDRVLVAVHWEGRNIVVDAQGRLSKTGQGSLRRTLLVLGRKPNVNSDPNVAICSSHCPACGAPETHVASHACEFCGEVLNDGSLDWILLEAYSLSSSEARSLLEQANLAAKPQENAAAEDVNGHSPAPRGMELLAWTLQLALADNEIDATERKLIHHVAKTRHISSERVDALIASNGNGEIDLASPSDIQEGRRWLEAMADAGLADGRIEPAELTMLTQAGTSLGYSRYDVQQILRSRQRSLYRQAREEMKAPHDV